MSAEGRPHDDADLTRRAKEGDTDAYVELVRAHQPPGLGREVSLDEALGITPIRVVGPSTLGVPAAVYVGELSSDSVTPLWGPSGAAPPVNGAGVGVLLTEMPGSTDHRLIERQLGPDTTLETVTVGCRTVPA